LPDLAALELLPDAVVVVRADGTIHHCGAMAARLLEAPAGSIVGRDAAEVLPLRDDAGRDWWSFTKPLDADARLLPRVPPRDLLLTTPSGRNRLVTLSASRIPGDDHYTEYLVLVLRRADSRQRLDAARSDLVSTVSHEIRSPLTSVKGFTKTLLAKWDRFTDEQKQQMLATVNEDADRVTRLLGELLDVSRIDAGRLQLRRQMVDVASIVDRVAERVRVSRDAAIANTLPHDLPKLYADADKIEQVFVNLIENALKYGAGQVTISANYSDEFCEFAVSDEGRGIPEQYLVAIFTKFFRRTGERRTGTGLGLYITKGIVEAHSGKIWATSPPDQGAVFHFTLPRGGLELAGVDRSVLR
jgi:hypothetical protein